MKTAKPSNVIFVSSQAELVEWLAKNYTQKESVWLHYYKSSLKKSDVTYSTIVDALLCFGWIDSLPRKVDAEQTSIRISPRNPKSNWSKVNKVKVAGLIKSKRMQPPGLEAVRLAKKTGTWNALNDVDNLKVPNDLGKVLDKHKARSLWDKRAPSYRRGVLESLFNLKTNAARERKINTIVNELIAAAIN